VGLAAHGDGGPDEGQPDEEVAVGLLGPGQRGIEDIAEEDASRVTPTITEKSRTAVALTVPS